MGVSKKRGKKPKMDGENNGKAYFLMDDLGVPKILGNIHMIKNPSSSQVREAPKSQSQSPSDPRKMGPWLVGL